MKEEIGVCTEMLLSHIKKSFISISYGEFEGMKNPSLHDLFLIQGLVTAAINEKQLTTKSDTV